MRHTQAAGRDISNGADVASLTAIIYMLLIIISYDQSVHVCLSDRLFYPDKLGQIGIEQGLTSHHGHQTHYRSYWGPLLQVI